MDHPTNPFKAAIARGEHQTGIWCTMGDPVLAELLAGCGYDWIMFDTEHSIMDPPKILSLLQAVAPYPVTPVVRPGSLDLAEIKKLLDCGAQTLLVPFVQNAEEAALAASAVAYPPEGVRGVSTVTRASRFGAVAGYAKAAREEICLIVQIETQSALDELEAICAVPGVDAVFIGPADLAASLGYVGEQNHPEMRKVVYDAMRRIRAAGKPAGFLSPDPAYCAAVVEAGCLFTSIDVDAALLRRAAVAKLTDFKG
ncbi:MAG: 4-hydroxy-2-oxoheptanedioate aldolase [Acuticoccus sp.]